MLKKQALFVSILYTFALLIFSLITIDLGGIETFAPSNGDKIFHFCAYALLVWIWCYALKNRFNVSTNKAIFSVTLFAILFGIIIEVLQKVLTHTRFFDVDDIIANVLGASIAAIILLFNTKRDVKK